MTPTAKFCKSMSSEFIGRIKEMAEIKDHLEESMKGNGRLVLVMGETGIGKSRLLEELGRYAETKGVLYLKGRSLYQENSEPYLPFIEAFGRYLSSETYLEEDDKRALIGGISDEVFSLGILPLGQGVDSPTNTKPGLSLQEKRDRLFASLSKVVIDISKKKPLLVVLDDIQWADDSSLQLLHYLARNIQNTKVLMCASYCPEDLEKNGCGPHPLSETIDKMKTEKLFYEIQLGRFDENCTARIIESLVDRKCLPPEFVKILYEESEGNPYFIEEVLKSLDNEGLIDMDSYSWDGKIDTSLIRIPGTIGDVIARRIDGLDDKIKTVLRCASIIGNSFSFELLQKVCEVSEEELIDALDESITTNIIHEDKISSEERYKFDHALTREVIYKSMTKSRRRLMHKKVGYLIEELYPERIGEMVYNLAHHFQEGRDAEKTLTYSVRAGQMATEAFAPEEAIRHFLSAKRTLEEMNVSMENLAKKLAVVAKLGEIHSTIGEWDKSLDYFKEALNLSQRLGDELEMAKAYRSTGHIKQNKGEYDEALENFKLGLEISEKLTDIHGLADTYRGLGRVFWRKGEFERAIDYYEWSLGLTKKIQDENVMAATCIELGNVYSELGEWEKALEYQQTSLELLERLKNFYEIGRSYNNIGVTYARKGDVDLAITQYEKSIEVSYRTGNIRMTGWALFNAGEAYARLGQFEKAIEYCDRSLSIFERLGEKLGISGSFLSYGIIFKLQKQWDKAVEYFEESMRIRKDLEMPYRLADGYLEFGLLYKEKGDMVKAKDYLEKAQDIFKNLGAKESLRKVKEELKSINGMK
ncbi:MAG: tetratricopeptide repeat protein [Thermoplasmata archaeon]|nr:MAG: tetratricopeptide repeat protein [Thermoplasmata archaeon]